MSANIFGHILKLTTFGESHGKSIGGVVDGLPPNILIDEDFIKTELERRNPSGKFYHTKRMENDHFEILSGIDDQNKSLGLPIAFYVKNRKQKEADYDHLKNVLRPSHGDFTYWKKYKTAPLPGGGRASGRETIARVIGGAVAKLYLKKFNIQIHAYVKKIGHVGTTRKYNIQSISRANKDGNLCPDAAAEKEMLALLKTMQKEGNTIGGQVHCVIKNVMPGLGEPVFNKLQADLAHAMMSIPAAKGFEYGKGFAASEMTGEAHNDLMDYHQDFSFKTNHAGGIVGGISSGQDIYFNVAFKPISSIQKKQSALDIYGKQHEVKIEGRHDVCPVPRVVVVVEAMAALVIADHLLLSKRLDNS